MELKEKVIKILQEETYCDNSMGNFLKEEDFELIADKIVKLFAIPVVTNRNLTYRVMLRRCGAINNADGTYTIYEADLKAWFENGDHLKEYTDYDLF